MQRPGMPQWTGTNDSGDGKGHDSSFGKTGWIIVGVAAAFVVVLLVWVQNKEGGIKKKTAACEDVCESLQGCVEVGYCQSQCHFNAKVKDCTESSATSCEAFKTCVGRDMLLFRGSRFDDRNDLDNP